MEEIVIYHGEEALFQGGLSFLEDKWQAEIIVMKDLDSSCPERVPIQDLLFIGNGRIIHGRAEGYIRMEKQLRRKERMKEAREIFFGKPSIAPSKTPSKRN